MQPRNSKRSRICSLGTCPVFIKFYLTFIHITKVKINIHNIRDKKVILNFLYSVIILELIEI